MKLPTYIRRLPDYIDEPLMIAHLLGGANGVDFAQDDETEIARRVQIAIKYGREIRRQLTLDRNQPKTQIRQLPD